MDDHYDRYNGMDKLSTYLASLGTDCISREQAIDAVMECYDNDELLEVYVWKLNELPPIQPKRGRWIKLDMHRGMADHKCTACEQECYVPTCMGEPLYAFCPNCGSYNGGEQDDKCRQV